MKLNIVIGVMEEMRARDQHVLQLAENVDNLTLLSDYETEQKVLRLEKIVSDLGKERSRSSDGFEYFVGGMAFDELVDEHVMTFL
ncbi:hypothetical protein DY000_02051329 [Brassica cretica]|uniref:Uncharacterized protein n=1 Tax=Brassica cretica TaxID=69181 RepID=A0ABQ7F488_BRACR|nr:hypothetical protein DY000_02051329 [Brassica cretica]